MFYALFNLRKHLNFKLKGQSSSRNLFFAACGIPNQQDVEVLDLSDNSKTCPKPDDYPRDTFGPIGTYVDEYVYELLTHKATADIGGY